MGYLILSVLFTFLLFVIRRTIIPIPILLDTTLSVSFIIIIGFFMGKFFEYLHFPAISGYLITGLILSPYAFHLLNIEVLNNLSFIGEIALSFIALQSGMEMRISFLRKHGSSIVRLTLSIALVTFCGVFIISLLFFKGRSVALPLQGAILLGVLLILKSPISTIAVIKESGTKTEMGDKILGIAILKDIIVILIFAVLIPIFSGENPSAMSVTFELVGSLIAGVIVGVIVTLYIRHVNVETQVFVFILAFFISQVRFIHLDPLLVSIITGFFIENFTFERKRFQRILDDISPGIYLLFFVLADASMNIHIMISLLPITLLFVAVKWIFTELGLIVGTKDSIMRRFGSVGLINQSGLSLILVLLVEEALPQVGNLVKGITISVIITTDLFAPILFKKALIKVSKIEGG